MFLAWAASYVYSVLPIRPHRKQMLSLKACKLVVDGCVARAWWAGNPGSLPSQYFHKGAVWGLGCIKYALPAAHMAARAWYMLCDPHGLTGSKYYAAQLLQKVRNPRCGLSGWPGYESLLWGLLVWSNKLCFAAYVALSQWLHKHDICFAASQKTIFYAKQPPPGNRIARHCWATHIWLHSKAAPWFVPQYICFCSLNMGMQ